MKKLVPYIFILFSFFTTQAAEKPKNKSVVFVEQGIEFVVYKNGRFDYAPLRRNAGTSVHIATRNGSNININTNNRDRILVERDRAGRIVRINNVFILYHRNNKVAQIGGTFIDYKGPSVYASYDGYYSQRPMPRQHRPNYR
ncbi:hypothetical protein K5I29_11655 [Flavobacterium agricola]|uniref:Uncharacterized protein n=1 Tax=Flavobacterium agricola TaxID=2870839 RepID=A0ABY6LXQ1_9FLAO|nr:hypothetical protein [Flavobacterium agricola]UYW01114.1 hypothetical protein K5I29_11655 [Flavobacterium agricola]